MGSHSPAPWTAPHGSVAILDADGNTIAELHSPGRIRPHLDEDGKVIVAAPDMLAVLRRARAAFKVEYNAAGDPIGVSHGSDALRDLVRELDQIIARAEGSEPGALPEPLRNIDTQRELRLFAADRGRRWKAVLRGYWERGEPVPDYPHLYGLRNSLGPSWLDAFQLPKREVEA